MKELVRMVVVLTLICLVAGMLLAWVNSLTAEPIRRAEKKDKLAAIEKVLSEFDNQPSANTFAVEEKAKMWTFSVARLNDKFAGAAFEATSSKGYGGDIVLMVGVDADAKVHAIEILKHKETPGLGARITGNTFKDLFAGRSIRKTQWRVKKDRGQIAEITAATISSRAVVEAVKAGLDVYLKYEAAIKSTRAGKNQPTATN